MANDQPHHPTSGHDQDPHSAQRVNSHQTPCHKFYPKGKGVTGSIRTQHISQIQHNKVTPIHFLDLSHPPEKEVGMTKHHRQLQKH
ncbi:hypothetical protein Nepgr_005226 [Nepenthes gracilis]|uniref:Uncharacterized protein n=1 Tax=Nepenthes gracilis TaxID=150966 RepID=A0AAD3XG81_NEPGR|nr:hypothetical protein Nepgr_005226 [Nepenthes gracilis]